MTGAVLANVLALLAIIVPVGVVYVGWRGRELRREEVSAWAGDAIDALETVVLLCIHVPPSIDDSTYRSRREDVLFRIPCLVERGRLFFRNEIKDDWGQDKLPAYRGRRPVILDTLVTAYQIADRLQSREPAERDTLKKISLHALKQFVSLAQKEVGRSRTAQLDTRIGGSHIDVARMLDGGFQT